MKLGVSYNLFDGEELLEGSILCIRNSVDYISVVYQTKSNFGYDCSENLEPLLSNLKKNNLIDEIIKYEPRIVNGHHNELLKRNLGLKLSKQVGCTHHMAIDTDEYYIESEFIEAKQIIIDNDYDSSYCQMLSYYKSWEYILDPPENYYVSFISKTRLDSNFNYGSPTPVLVDPTRRLSPSDNPIIFNRKTIQMHHGSYIRNNIKTKLINSSSVLPKEDIENITNHYNNWQYPDPVLWGGYPSKLHNIKKIKSFFNEITDTISN